MEKRPPKRRGLERLSLAAALCLLLRAAPAAANPDLNADFTSMMGWLSHELAQGLAFNAGETLDPPQEITGPRLQPDLSLGGGEVPLDKSKFPTLQTAAIQDSAAIFPSSVLFPNLVGHLRMGLPWRSDFNIRAANMTTPPGYKLSPTTTGGGQSNSIGFGLRKHVLGGDLPLLSLGANYNHVFGKFFYHSSFSTTDQGLTITSPIDGKLEWNVNSFGLNAVMSQTFGRWTPFVGLGYNYVTGSVSAKLSATPDTFAVSPLEGDASAQPEKNQARVMFGTEISRTWVNIFANAEIKTVGIGSGKSWIVQSGASLPFSIGAGGVHYSTAQKAREAREAAERRAALREEPQTDEQPEAAASAAPELIYIQ